MDKLGKICPLHWNEHLLIRKIAKYKGDLLKTNEDTSPQCRNIAYIVGGGGTCLSP